MQITKNYPPELGFFFVSSFVVFIGTVLLKLIKEPQIHKPTSTSRDLKFLKLSITQKLQVLTSEVVQESKNNPIIPLCYAGVFVIKLVLILFNTFVILWVSSFIIGKGIYPDREVLLDEKEAKGVI